MLNYKVIHVVIELYSVVSLVRGALEDKGQLGIALTHFHRHHVFVFEPREFFEGFFEVVNPGKKLSGYAHVLERIVSIQGMLRLISFQL